MSASKASRWTCTNCRRSVPADVLECRCGTNRRASEVQAVREGGEASGSLSITDLLGQLAVLGVVVYMGFAWQRTPGGPPPPGGQPIIPLPGPSSASTGVPTRAAPPPAREPFDTPSPAFAPSPEEPDEPPPPPMSSPEPRPPQTPRAERSELDVKRDLAEKRLDRALTRLGGEVRRLSLNAGRFESLCLGGRGEPASCERAFREISASGDSLVRGMQEAEEEARRAWVAPGVVRDLRTRHGLDEATIGDLSARVQRMTSKFGGK